MRKTLTSRAFWMAVGAMIFFAGSAVVIPGAALLEVVSGLLLGVAVAITLTWMPAAIIAIREGVGDGYRQLNLAIMVTWLAIAIQSIRAIVFRWMGRPDWLIEPHFSAFIAYLVLLAGMLYLIAPGTEDGQVPVKNWTMMIVSVAAGGVVAGVMIGRFVLH